MQTPKPDQERPETAREAAKKRRTFDMGEVLGMRHLRVAIIDIDPKPEEPPPRISPRP
jgi:hypothetical protein